VLYDDHTSSQALSNRVCVLCSITVDIAHHGQSAMGPARSAVNGLVLAPGRSHKVLAIYIAPVEISGQVLRAQNRGRLGIPEKVLLRDHRPGAVTVAACLSMTYEAAEGCTRQKKQTPLHTDVLQKKVEPHDMPIPR